MSRINSKFNIMDLIVLVFLLLVIISALVKGFAVRKDEMNKTITDAVVVIRISDISEKNVQKIKKGDKIYSKEIFGTKPVGVVAEDIVEIQKTESGDNNKTPEEYTLKLRVNCIIDNDGLYSINDKYITPGMTFSADNGIIGFHCDVVSVKKAK